VICEGVSGINEVVNAASPLYKNFLLDQNIKIGRMISPKCALNSAREDSSKCQPLTGPKRYTWN
jgi:hypothetical protein